MQLVRIKEFKSSLLSTPTSLLFNRSNRIESVEFIYFNVTHEILNDNTSLPLVLINIIHEYYLNHCNDCNRLGEFSISWSYNKIRCFECKLLYSDHKTDWNAEIVFLQIGYLNMYMIDYTIRDYDKVDITSLFYDYKHKYLHYNQQTQGECAFCDNDGDVLAYSNKFNEFKILCTFCKDMYESIDDITNTTDNRMTKYIASISNKIDAVTFYNDENDNKIDIIEFNKKLAFFNQDTIKWLGSYYDKYKDSTSIYGMQLNEYR